MSESKPIARGREVVIQEMGDEILIYDLKTDQAFSLNITSSMVWLYSDGENTIKNIAEKMSEKMTETVSVDLVWLALEKLRKQNLLEDGSGLAFPYRETSRRQLIRQIGLSSMIALPVIGTLVAPLPAHAQSVACTTGASGRALNCPCTAIGQCQPPASRCCLSSPGAPGNQTCVVTATQIGDGGVCGNSCSCISNCCAGGFCIVSMTVTSGNPCTIGCQCVSGTCSGGTMCA